MTQFYHKFLVVGGYCWGAAKTLKEAKANYRNEGGKMKGVRTFIGVSEKPFKTGNEEPKENEAHFYINEGARFFSIWYVFSLDF